MYLRQYIWQTQRLLAARQWSTFFRNSYFCFRSLDSECTHCPICTAARLATPPYPSPSDLSDSKRAPKNNDKPRIDDRHTLKASQKERQVSAGLLSAAPPHQNVGTNTLVSELLTRKELIKWNWLRCVLKCF